MDDHKRHINGFRGDGKVCSCCRETTKKEATRLARRRLRAGDKAAWNAVIDTE